MAMKHFLTALGGHWSVKASPTLNQAIRSSSTSPAVAPSLSTPLPRPPPPIAMVYDRLAKDVKSKLQRLENPDPRFLEYESPHPTLTDHSILRARVAVLWVLMAAVLWVRER